MKRRLLVALCAVAMIAFVGAAAYAQDHHEHHWDKDHPMFDDHEHVVVNGWWAAHRDHPVIGFRVEDRLPAAWESQLRVGFVLGPDWRRRWHPVPADLYAQLPPPPRFYEYHVLGGHVVLVDRRNWHVADVININL